MQQKQKRTKKQNNASNNLASDFHKMFNKKMLEISNKTGERPSQVFNDFCTAFHISIANAFYKKQEMENEYLATIKKYPKDCLNLLCEMGGVVIMALQEKHRDFLGEIYMANDFGNDFAGQFFTPYNLALMMAKMLMCMNEKPEPTINEPACGSGVMIIAAHEVNPNIIAVCQDIDFLCFKMAYIQLSLLGVKAKIILGDSLALENKYELVTPALASAMVESSKNPNDRIIEYIRSLRSVEIIEEGKEEAQEIVEYIRSLRSVEISA